MKKLQCSLISALLIAFMSVNAVFATNVSTSAGQDASSEVSLNHGGTLFSVTVPMGLPVTMMEDGSIVTANTASIVNNSLGGVVVTDVDVIGVNGWQLVDFDTDFNRVFAGVKKFGFQMQGEDVATDGSVALSRTNWPVILPGDSMPLDYDATLPVQTAAIYGTNIAEVVFTADFWTDGEIGGGNPVTPPIEPPTPHTPPSGSMSVPKEELTLEQAQALWTWTDNGDTTVTITAYKGSYGSGLDLIVPYKIDGKRVTASTANISNGDINGENSLKSLQFPSGIAISGLGASGGADWDTVVLDEGCSIAQPGFNGTTAQNIYVNDGCTVGGGAFNEVKADNVYIGKNVTLSEAAFNSSDGRYITNITIDSDIPKNLFNSSSRIKNITLGKNVNSIGVAGLSVVPSLLESINGLENVSTFEKYAVCYVSSWLYGDPQMSYSLFSDNYKGTLDIVLKDGVTVGAGAFYKAPINSLVIEGNATLEASAFDGTIINNFIVKEGIDLNTVIAAADIGTVTFEGDNTVSKGFSATTIETFNIGDDCILGNDILYGGVQIENMSIGKNISVAADGKSFNSSIWDSQQ